MLPATPSVGGGTNERIFHERRPRTPGHPGGKPGKADELGAFLAKAQPLAVAEPGTITWYAFKLSDTTYGIFDTFPDENGRQAHLNGPIAAALGQTGPGLLAKDPDIRMTDILAAK
jgi:quinol monooxygenase YgiN